MSEAGLQDLLAAVGTVAWEADRATHRFLSVSRHAADLLGYPVEQWLEDGFWKARIHPDDQEETVQRFFNSAGAGEHFELDYRMCAAHGSTVWVREVGSAGSAPTVCGALVDITELKTLEHRLGASEAHVRALVECVSDGLLIVSSDGRVDLANALAATLLGYPRDELIGQSIDNVVPGLGSTGRDLRGAERGSTPESGAMGPSAEFLARRKDGSKIPVAITIAPLGAGFYATVYDAHDRRAELNAHQLETELARVSRAATFGELAASLAHELNQPLCAIVSNGRAGQRLLLQKGNRYKEVRAALTDIVQDGKRAGAMIDKLRAMFKKGEPVHEPVSMNELVRGIIPLVHSDGERRQAHLRLDLDPRLPPVLGDQIQLQQVLVNLILNAFDAVESAGTDSPEVVVGTAGIGEDGIELTVRDNGIGMDAETMGRIFDAFYTTKPDGLGMGLTICRTIVEAHGGRLWPTANAEGGVTFHLCIPCPVNAAA